ncbi:MAG TPA: hypothetical protein VHP60_07395 [Thermoanaerobaculia bacterium]|nr:hypothetical protein [Thermoanaerobaculia bacterium]
MDNFYSSATADQARKTAKEAQKLGSDVKKDFDGTVARGKDAASDLTDDAKDAARNLSDRAREYSDAARRNLGKAAGKVSDYADANTALVAVAAFGVGLLVGYLVTRES